MVRPKQSTKHRDDDDTGCLGRSIVRESDLTVLACIVVVEVSAIVREICTRFSMSVSVL